jgi:hypothetical protein
MDWCEQNNQHINNIIEFYNSFSSLFYIFVAITIPNDKPFNELKVYVYLIGINSFLYHATLNIYFQITDELAIMLFIYGLINVYLNKFYWSYSRYIITVFSSLLLLFIYPIFNAFILLIVGIICIVYFNYFEKDLDKFELNMAKIKFITSVIFWVIDKFCINGIHLHFAWHFYSSLAIYWVIKWLLKYKYKKDIHIKTVDMFIC